MFLELQSYFFFLVLCLSYLNSTDLGKTLLIRFFFGYIKCLAYFIIDVSYYYMKIIGVFLIWYQALFFSNLIPNFIQLFLSFHFLFNFLWDLFLLLIIYSSFLVCLPMYALRSNSKKLISIETEIKSLIILNLILFFNFEIFFYYKKNNINKCSNQLTK